MPAQNQPNDTPSFDALSRELGNAPDAVEREARRLLTRARVAGDPVTQARALVLVADARFRAGATEEATTLFDAAVLAAELSNDPEVLVATLVARAGKLGDLGRTAEALESGMRARSLSGGLSPLLQARATHAIGWTLLRARDLERAHTWARMAMEQADKSGHPLARYAAATLLGAVLKENNRFAEALDIFEAALNDARPHLDASRIGASLANIGNCLKGLGRVDEALERLDDALNHIDRAGHRLNRAGLLMLIGRTHLDRADHAKATDYLQRALEAIEDVGHLVWMHNCLGALSEAYAASGDYERAFQTLRHSIEVERRTVDQQRSTKVGEIQAREDEAEQRRLREDLACALADVEAARARSEAHAEAISAFLAVTSHEIRTPLTGVLGLADLLAEEPLPPAWRENVEDIRASGRIVLGVVNDILDFNHLASGRMELDPVDCSLPAALFDAMRSYTSKAQRQDIGFSFLIEEGTPLAVHTDDRRISQIVGNLCSNALRFTETGRVEIALRGAGPRRIRIEVRDTGPGLTKEQASRLFQPFVQADRRVSREHGGSGLGLAICRQLVQLFHGRIGATGTPGEGSTFWFELELNEVRTRVKRALHINLANGDRMPIHLRISKTGNHGATLTGHILVVEDNIINQRVVTGLLSSLGAQCTVVDNGEEAITLVDTESFDVVLMDGELLGIDGWETTRRMRANGVTTPIFALTAALMDDVRRNCEDAGMDGIIAKPVTRDELLESLLPVLGQTETPAGPEPTAVPV